jgi:predicted ATPase
MMPTKAMLTRLYIDNYKCFSNFELKLGSLQLLLGDNGTGKSSVLDAVAGLQALLSGDLVAGSGLGGTTLTRWDRRPRQTFELDIRTPLNEVYQYHLELEVDPDHETATVARESLSIDGRPIFRDDGVTAEAFSSTGETMRGFVDRRLSGVATNPLRLKELYAFEGLMRRLVVLRPWPAGMAAASKHDAAYLARDGSNFSAWYRWLDPQQTFEARQSFHQHLTETLSGYSSIHFSRTGENERILKTKWSAGAGERPPSFELSFDELSDGQRMLVLLYALLSLSVDEPLTILLDEPTNFVSLSEIEPWLHELEERAEAEALQAILVSHNSEVLDAWAGAYGIRFDRDAAGPVRARRFAVAEDDPLTPSERIARGWDDEDG